MVSPDLPTAASPRLSLQRGDQIYVPLQAELPVMPGSRATRQNMWMCLIMGYAPQMEVSINMGTPKWMVHNGKSDEKDDLGVPSFQDAPILMKMIITQWI